MAAYSFDDVSGSTVPDASGGGNHGTLNGATPAHEGHFGAALSFDGVDDFVAVADSTSLDLTDGMTLEAWVKPESLGRSWRTAVIKEQASELSYALYAHTGGYGPSGHAFTGGDDERARSTTPVEAGTWTHLAVTYDGRTIRLYRDGTQIESRSAGGPIATSSGELRIGGTQLWSEWFHGLIDEVRVYNR
ncbi:MAG TPA: LamG domain-containing protein, partial [Actinomycetota bacterium]